MEGTALVVRAGRARLGGPARRFSPAAAWSRWASPTSGPRHRPYEAPPASERATRRRRDAGLRDRTRARGSTHGTRSDVRAHHRASGESRARGDAGDLARRRLRRDQRALRRTATVVADALRDGG